MVLAESSCKTSNGWITIVHQRGGFMEVAYTLNYQRVRLTFAAQKRYKEKVNRGKLI